MEKTSVKVVNEAWEAGVSSDLFFFSESRIFIKIDQDQDHKTKTKDNDKQHNDNGNDNDNDNDNSKIRRDTQLLFL